MLLSIIVHKNYVKFHLEVVEYIILDLYLEYPLINDLVVIEIIMILVKITMKPYEEYVKIIIMRFIFQYMDLLLHVNNVIVEY